MNNAPDVLRDIILQPGIESETSSDEDLIGLLESSTSDGSSSSSSSESDAEGAHFDDIDGNANAIRFPLLQMILHGRRRSKVDEYLNVVHGKSSTQFRQDFRLTRQTTYNLIDRLHASGFIPTHEDGRPKISAELSFLMFLRFVSNNDPHRTIGELFDMSESSVFRIIRRVVDWLMTLLAEYIAWPQENEVRRVKPGFAEIRDDMPGCMGAVDGSHIRIIRPSVENNRDFWNRKKFYSLNLTALADADRKFLMVTCGRSARLQT